MRMMSGALQRDGSSRLRGGRARLLVVLATAVACGLTVLRDLRLVLPIDRLLDFGAFLASGKAALQGLNPYGVYPLVPIFVWNGHEAPGINLNPPVSLFLFAPFSLVSPETALHLWTGLTLVAYVAALTLLAWAHPEVDRVTRILWAISAWGIWNTLQLGQVCALLALLASVAYVCLERRRMLLAGIALGALVALKPNFAVWPVLLLIGAERRVFGFTVLTAAVLTALPALVFGPGAYAEWSSALTVNTLISFPSNGSLVGAGTRIGQPLLGYFASAVLLVGLAALVHRRRPHPQAISRLALTAALLASPIAWVGYVLVLLPLVFSRKWTLLMVLTATFWTLPDSFAIAGFQNTGWHFWVFGFAYCLALIATLIQDVYEVFTVGSLPKLHVPIGRFRQYVRIAAFQSIWP